MLQNIVSDFTGNAAWELIFTVMLTIVARILKLVFGKKMTTTHEIYFWVGCIFCGTIAIEAINFGIVKPIREQTQNKQIVVPNLHCSVVNGMILPPYQGSPVRILYQLKVVNSGSPSVAWKWSLDITFNTGQSLQLNAAENPSSEVIAPQTTNQQAVTFPSNYYLPNSLLETPLETGAGKVGWVDFEVDTATMDDLERIGNKYVLQFQDCNGNITSVTNFITQKGEQFAP